MYSDDWYSGPRRRTPSPDYDFEASPLAGWKVSDKDLQDSDLHPSQLDKPRLFTGPYEAAMKKKSWIIPVIAHQLSLLLGQITRPKFCSSDRWLYTPSCKRCGWLSNSRFTNIKLFSSADGKELGTIGRLNLDAVRDLATASPFGMGGETVYDDSVRRGTEVRAAQLHFGLVLPLPGTELSDDLWHGLRHSMRDGAAYFKDIAFHAASYLFPGARSVKLVFYKLAMYTPGGHFKMHKDTTHADSHVGTLLVGCGLAQDDEPGDEEWDTVDPGEDRLKDIVEATHRFRRSEDSNESPSTDGYTGGDLVILNDLREQTRFHIRPGQVLAFCTDVPHAVDVVTSGVKVTLQFDIYLEDASVPREHTVAIVDMTNHQAGYSRPRPDADDSEDAVFDDAEDDTPANVIKADEPPLPPCPSCNHPGCVLADEQLIERYLDYCPYVRTRSFNHDEHSASDLTHWTGEHRAFGEYPHETFTTVIDRFIAHLLALLRDPSPPEGAPGTVAFLLSHMYRKRSICPEYLKTIDDVLYRALVATGQLKIVLHHVTFEVDFRHHRLDRYHKLTLCPPYTAGVSPKDIVEPVVILDRPGSDATLLHSQQDEAIERGDVFVGNQAFEENAWYVAGAMFVTLL